MAVQFIDEDLVKVRRGDAKTVTLAFGDAVEVLGKDKTYTAAELKKMFTGDPKGDAGEPQCFFGFQRTNFGIVHVRTDGDRVLILTHSGKQGMNEAYRCHVDKGHRVKFAAKVQTR